MELTAAAALAAVVSLIILASHDLAKTCDTSSFRPNNQLPHARCRPGRGRTGLDLVPWVADDHSDLRYLDNSISPPYHMAY